MFAELKQFKAFAQVTDRHTHRHRHRHTQTHRHTHTHTQTHTDTDTDTHTDPDTHTHTNARADRLLGMRPLTARLTYVKLTVLIKWVLLFKYNYQYNTT